MNVVINSKWQAFVDEAVKNGRYASTEEAVSAGLSLLAQYEARVTELRALIKEAEGEGGEGTSADMLAEVEEALAEVKQPERKKAEV